MNGNNQTLRYGHNMRTFQVHREPAEHLINVAMGVPDRQKINIYFLECTTVNQTLKVREYEPILVLPFI
jgi:hypothetical protein